MIVLDASVVLKWIFVDEDRGERARYYKERHISKEEIIAVPELFFYEVANVLATKTRLLEEDAADAFTLIWNFDLEAFKFGAEEFLSGIALSRQYKISLYDAAYIELAKRLNCNFITADRNLYEKTKGIRAVEVL
jgi:predicted nucleic acid-binding protein